MKCPKCLEELMPEDVKMKYSKTGRDIVCQKCGCEFHVSRILKDHKRSRPKHMSKKARLAARKEKNESEIK